MPSFPTNNDGGVNPLNNKTNNDGTARKTIQFRNQNGHNANTFSSVNANLNRQTKSDNRMSLPGSFSNTFNVPLNKGIELSSWLQNLSESAGRFIINLLIF